MLSEPKMPPLDYALSPITGWTRDHWVVLADLQLLAVRPYFSQAKSTVDLPGRASASGSISDGIEGFARTFMIAAFRVAGENGADPFEHLDWYREGLIAGTAPNSQHTWLPIKSNTQPVVEAATITLALELTKPWLWDTLTTGQQVQIGTWLHGSSTSVPNENNWVLFQLLVAEFLDGAGFESNRQHIDYALQRLEDWYAGAGWYKDGDNDGSGLFFDYYCAWAMHLYPLLWTRFSALHGNPQPAQESRFAQRLGEFVGDHAHFFGANGSPIFQGRSLLYRYAAVAPLFMAEMVSVNSLSPGQTRRITTGAVKHFVESAAFENYVPSMGWHGEFLPMTQPYSGPASAYWSGKAFLGLLLPATHPVWSEVEQPAPVECASGAGASQRVVTTTNSTLHSERHQGVAVLVNHGSDKYYLPDAPNHCYNRFAYTSHTAPVFTEAGAWDCSFGLLNAAGQVSYRSKIHPWVASGTAGAAAVASWHAPVWSSLHDERESSWRVTTASCAAAGLELRVHAVSGSAPCAVIDSSFALAGSEPPQYEIREHRVQVTTPGLHAELWPISGYDDKHDTVGAVATSEGSSPLGRFAAFAQLWGQALSQVPGQASVFAAVHFVGTQAPQVTPLGGAVSIDGQTVSAVVHLSDGSTLAVTFDLVT